MKPEAHLTLRKCQALLICPFVAVSCDIFASLRGEMRRFASGGPDMLTCNKTGLAASRSRVGADAGAGAHHADGGVVLTDN